MFRNTDSCANLLPVFFAVCSPEPSHEKLLFQKQSVFLVVIRAFRRDVADFFPPLCPCFPFLTLIQLWSIFPPFFPPHFKLSYPPSQLTGGQKYISRSFYLSGFFFFFSLFSLWRPSWFKPHKATSFPHNCFLRSKRNPTDLQQRTLVLE